MILKIILPALKRFLSLFRTFGIQLERIYHAMILKIILPALKRFLSLFRTFGIQLERICLIHNQKYVCKITCAEIAA